MLLDVKDTHAAHPVLRGSILVGSFPREMVVEGQSLFLTNYNSKTLSVIDTTKLPKGS